MNVSLKSMIAAGIAATTIGAGTLVASAALADDTDGAGTNASLEHAHDAADTHSGKPAATGKPADAGQGSDVSHLATTTDLTGVDKGAAISTLASGGQSQAGQHGDR